jgi:4-oxalocrotonate tautomerase
MPFINVKSAGQLTKEQKAQIAEEISAMLEKVANKPRKYTYIVFEEVEYENWAIAGKLLSD